jgi:hypothetical protein
MTIIELEQRVVALEQAVAQLKHHPATLPAEQPEELGAEDPTEDQLIPGAEYPLVLSVPPRRVVRLRGRIVKVEAGRQEFGLSPKEWASLQLEEDDE